MKIRIYKIQIITIITSIIFLSAFIVNLTLKASLYNQNLNIVPEWQSNSSISDSNFINFMNVVSNLFNPIICAGYIGLFWLISSRKLQILVFLVWFIFLSWFLSLLKMGLEQPRPYWIQGSGMKMLQWTCYTQYGLPSGHAMLGLVLMEFIIRFFAKRYKKIKRNIIFLYIITFMLQFLVMFSRVILGMHSFNQVLFGALMGIYSIAVYYLFVQKLILKYFEILIKTKQDKPFHIKIILAMAALSFLIESLVAFVPKYENTKEYFNYIISINGCQSSLEYKSFHYRCLQDSALIMANIGIFISLIFMKNPENLAKELTYPKLSLKFLKKISLMILCAIIPAAIFLNPLWVKIGNEPIHTTIVIWICQNIAFCGAFLMLLIFSPNICSKFNLQTYKKSNLYSQNLSQDFIKKSELQLEGEKQTQ